MRKIGVMKMAVGAKLGKEILGDGNRFNEDFIKCRASQIKNLLISKGLWE